jgi:plasmid stabilization system protein ParE
MMAELDHAASILAEFPEAGRSREDLAPGLRAFSVYPICCSTAPSATGAEIVRVLHGSRNITPDLF